MRDIVERLLEKRGLSTPEAIETFLHPDFDRDTHDPFLLWGMDRAVARVQAAIRSRETIALYGDFDCDGIPGTALLYDTFTKIGHTNLEVYIPHRDREGHGVHEGAIDTLAEKGVTLMITIDVGTTAIDAVAYAKKKGIDVIITDHHEPMRGSVTSHGSGAKEILPDAIAVINPKLGEYPYPDLCGAGVAWKLAQALLRAGCESGAAAFADIPEGWEKWLLDLVAIATVADLVPLTGENRALVYFGLTVMRKSPRKGIRALCSSARVKQRLITEDDIGFSFAPRINAASRMDEPELAFRLLTTHDADEAETIAAQLESLNRKRRARVAAMVCEAKARVHARYGASDRVVVLGDTAWKPSLCGLAANTIMNERGGLVCIWGRDAEGNLKGSCRSDGSLSVVELCSVADEAFIEFGGHHASGGFSVSHEAVHTLPQTLADAAKHITSRDVSVQHGADAELVLSDISETFFNEVGQLAPFGVGNPKPVFRVRATRITFARQFGKEMNHTEVQFVCSETGTQRRGFQFFKTPMDFTLAPEPGRLADVLATIEKDLFRGPGALVLRMVDILSPR